VLPNLTLNLGLRWDYESNMINNDYRTPPELVAALQSGCRTYSQPVGGRNTWCIRDFLDLNRFTTDGNDRDARFDMRAAALGFAWDVRGNSRTVVFGGWGKYYDRVILNDIFDEAYRQQFKIYSFCFSGHRRAGAQLRRAGAAVGPQLPLRRRPAPAGGQRADAGPGGLPRRQRAQPAALGPVEPRRPPAARPLAGLALPTPACAPTTT
jgi:hypothetical protein